MDEALRDAVYGNKPITPGGNEPVIDQAYAARGRAPLVHAISNAQVNESQIKLEEAKKAAAAEEQRQKDLTDPSKFQRLNKNDGGFGFYDPSGKEITAYEYARAVGTTVDKVLADSENPIDKNFRNDYNNLQAYFQAWANNDQKRIQAIQSQAPQLKNIKDPQELIKRFQQAYPTVYGMGGFKGAHSAGQKVGSSFIPSYGAASDEYDLGSDDGSGIGY